MVHQGVPQMVTLVLSSLNKDNVEQQADFLRQWVAKESDPSSWFVSFIVRRVSTTDSRTIEVIAQLIYYLNSEALWEMLVEETVCHAKQIINGLINPPAGGPQRSLRNLGVFLGLLTIGADRPIVLDTLDLKRSLIDAIGEGDEKLARVLPFLVHSLKASARSTIFHPFCSWLSPIFHLLEQLRDEPGLKMVFNLEIQSLFSEIRENSGPSLVDDIPKPTPNRATPIEPEHCQPHLPLPTAAQSFSNAFGFHHSLYPNVQAQETQMSSTMYQYYPQDMANDLYNGPFSPIEPNVTPQFNNSIYNQSQQPNQFALPAGRNLFSKLHQTHSAPTLDQFNVPEPQQNFQGYNNAPYGMISPPPKPGPLPFYKDQKFLWEMVQRLNFEFSQIFKILDKSRGCIIHGMQHLIQQAEEIIEQILNRLGDSVKQSAVSILHRDMVLVEDPVVLSMAFRSTFRILLYAMYEPRSAIEILHEKFTESIRSALDKAAKQSPIASRMGGIKAEIDHVAREFVATNSFVIVELITRTIERTAASMAELEYERLMFERSITLRTNATRPEMAKFIGQPHSMHVLNASLPHKLRRHAILEAKEQLILETFDSLSNELQSHLNTLFTLIPIQQEEEKRERRPEVPPVVPRNQREEMKPAYAASPSPDLVTSDFRRSSPVPLPCFSPSITDGSPVPFPCFSPSVIDRLQAVTPPTPRPDTPTLESTFEDLIEKLFREWCLALRNGCDQDSTAHQHVIDELFELGVTVDEAKISRFVYVGIQICLETANCLEKQEANDVVAASRQIHNYVTAFIAMIDCVAEKEHERTEKRLNFVQSVGGALIRLVVDSFSEDRANDLGRLQRSVFYYALRSLAASQLRPGTMCVVPFLEFLCHGFQKLNPLVLPGFTQSYVLLIVQPIFLSTLFNTELVTEETASSLFMLLHSPILSLLRKQLQLDPEQQDPLSLSLYSANSQLIRLLYTYYPAVLQNFHFTYVEMLPRICLHLRNYVLDAAVETTRTTYDPAKSFDEYCQSPQMNTNPAIHADLANIISSDLRQVIDNYLHNRSSVDPLHNICTFLKQPDESGVPQYNFTLMNGLVLYLGVKAINELKASNLKITVFNTQNTAEANVFTYLMVSLCNEGWFRFFTSITDQLRNASSHTSFYANILLHLFHTAHTDHIREIIARILLERLLASRPHPFGLKLVMRELMGNPEYRFMEFEFVHSAPTIERIVISIGNYLSVEMDSDKICQFFKYHNPKLRKEPLKRQSDSNNNKQAKRSFVRAATPTR